MKPNVSTKIIARLHPQANGRGLNIYNPYFERAGVNAIYILFQQDNLEDALDGLRKLKIAGAIPAGFEKDARLPEMMDDLDPIARRVGRVGVIVQEQGRLIGYYQAGYGLCESIKTISQIKNKRLVILGAGNVVRCLLAHLEATSQRPSSVEIYNRTLEKAKALTKEYKSISGVKSIDDLFKANGDIFINATYIGSPWNKGDDLVFTEEFVKRFDGVVDVTFVPLKSQLILVAEKVGIQTAPGWKMFVHQGSMCLNKILNITVDIPLLSELATQDFEKNWS